MDNPDVRNEYKPAVKHLPTPDVKVETTEQDNFTTTRQYPVIIPKAEREDFIIQVRASQINEIREVCNNIKEEYFPLPEIILFITSALIGSIISAIYSDLKITDTWGKINFILFPIICAVLGTIYFFKRKYKLKILYEICQQVLNKLPNPKKRNEH